MCMAGLRTVARSTSPFAPSRGPSCSPGPLRRSSTTAAQPSWTVFMRVCVLCWRAGGGSMALRDLCWRRW